MWVQRSKAESEQGWRDGHEQLALQINFGFEPRSRLFPITTCTCRHGAGWAHGGPFQQRKQNDYHRRESKI
jgi:hypothetical protein